MKLSAALLAIALSAPMGLINPAAAEELTKTELSPAQATKAAERLLGALKERNGSVVYDTPVSYTHLTLPTMDSV